MTKRFVLIDESSVNSYGFRTLLSGLDTSRFERNPVMLYQHDREQVIGRWENLTQEGGLLTADAVFDMDDETAAKVAKRVERGFLKGCSVGMRALRFNVPGTELQESELFEASIVTVPADKNALVLYDEDYNRMDASQIESLMLNFRDKQMNRNVSNAAGMEPAGGDGGRPVCLGTRTCEILGLKPDSFTLAELEASVQRYAQRMEELQGALQTAEARERDNYLLDAVRRGVVRPDDMPFWKKLASKDFETVRAMLDTKVEQASGAVRLADMVTKTHGAEVHAGWDYMRWMKEDPRGLARLRAENPMEFERLQGTLKN